ncbi:hypothetical protein JW887_02530 [Candidatus Dojkabacteria bacterium]|nr:hypothetical protein [Candidatus Dojkabacteria bacterium]
MSVKTILGKTNNPGKCLLGSKHSSLSISPTFFSDKVSISTPSSNLFPVPTSHTKSILASTQGQLEKEPISTEKSQDDILNEKYNNISQLFSKWDNIITSKSLMKFNIHPFLVKIYDNSRKRVDFFLTHEIKRGLRYLIYEGKPDKKFAIRDIYYDKRLNILHAILVHLKYDHNRHELDMTPNRSFCNNDNLGNRDNETQSNSDHFMKKTKCTKDKQIIMENTGFNEFKKAYVFEAQEDKELPNYEIKVFLYQNLRKLVEALYRHIGECRSFKF